ncbi:hypothetical protein [Shewanella sp. 10N.286.48.B5]|uniref:hypothetical protein n=1 Tax=Shewanella sp. 10N.286.48.B5 TaxID=1880834 RepID=UPI0039A6B7F9
MNNNLQESQAVIVEWFLYSLPMDMTTLPNNSTKLVSDSAVFQTRKVLLPIFCAGITNR